MTKTYPRKRPNSQKPLVFHALGRKMTFLGGPYRSKPAGVDGIKLAREIDLPYAHKVDIEDFSVPTHADLHRAVEVAIKIALIKGVVYSGCMGGIGRTGTLMAAISKVFVEGDPVEYVRDNYLGHAVETGAQRQLVKELDVSDIRKNLRKWAFLAWFRLLKV